MIGLYVSIGRQRSKRFEIAKERVTIGSDASNDLVLRDGGVAPFYGALVRVRERWFLSLRDADAFSSNRMRALEDGARVYVGEYVIVLAAATVALPEPRPARLAEGTPVDPLPVQRATLPPGPVRARRATGTPAEPMPVRRAIGSQAELLPARTESQAESPVRRAIGSQAGPLPARRADGSQAESLPVRRAGSQAESLPVRRTPVPATTPVPSTAPMGSLALSDPDPAPPALAPAAPVRRAATLRTGGASLVRSPIEKSLIDAILGGDEAARMVYADWLEGQGDPIRAEFLRLQRALDGMEPADPAQRDLLKARLERLRELAPKIDLPWRQLIGRPAVEGCRKFTFDFQCKMDWGSLAPTHDPGVRSCHGCGDNVYYATTLAGAREHASQGHCVVVDFRVNRSPDDLEAIEPYEIPMPGRPSWGPE